MSDSNKNTKDYLLNTIHKKTKMTIVIPCFNEPDLNTSLESIYLCDKPRCHVEVIVVINASENENETIIQQNKHTYVEATKWIKKNKSDYLNFYLLNISLPKKHAGVGLARKTGMDLAAKRLSSINQSNGIIICFDADSKCATNYLVAIEEHFEKNPKSPAASIYFEHPLEGDSFTNDIYEAITYYELYLRYYIEGLRYAKYPFAYHTIGSSMAVRANTYLSQGGMNKRKAGEDFYFLQKLIPLGHFTEINTTSVYPSPRISERVPFGTGKAIGDWLKTKNKQYPTFNPDIFRDLKLLCENIKYIYEQSPEHFLKLMPKSVVAYLNKNDFRENMTEIKSNVSTIETFSNRFYRWFNGLKVLQFVHFCRDIYYPNITLLEACNNIAGNIKNEMTEKKMLLYFRAIQKQ